MNDKHLHSAQELEQHLKTGQPCHDPAVVPLQEMSEALRREASTDTEHLESSVAAKQRQHLISMATSSSSSKRFFQKSWFAWGGGVAMVAVVLVVAFVVQRANPQLFKTVPSSQQIAAMVIPEAHAADAFSVFAEKQDASGADVATSFVVTSTVSVTASDLQQHLTLVPAVTNDGSDPQPVSVTIESKSANSFLVVPTSALDAAKVYKVQIDAKVQKADGSMQNRDFSWAFQTKNVFRVLSSVPGPNASGVPIDTGIEFAMSMPNWEDPSAHFSISPNVDGKFETHGRSLAFVPAHPLAYATVYTVSLSQGWKVTDSDRSLEKDVQFSFETQANTGISQYGTIPSIQPINTMEKTSPGRTFQFSVYASGNAKEADVTAFSLDHDKAKAFLDAYANIPWFATETRKATSTYEAYTTQKAFDATVGVSEQNYSSYMVLPKPLDAGRYLLRIAVKGGDTTWLFVESTNVATYVTSDAKQTLVWAMNAQTDQPLADMSVSLPQGQSKTDARGIATMDTPSVLTSTSTNDSVVMDVGTGDLSSLIVLTRMNRWYDGDFRGGVNASDQTISYLFIDRPLYRTTDSFEAFGIAQDRATGKAADQLTLEIRRGDVYDWFGGDVSQAKVYKKITLQTDDAGAFRGSMNWSLFAPGWYSASLKRNGQEIATRSFEVRDFVKPAYTISLSTTKSAVFAGDKIEGEVDSAFFNGTPMPKTKINFETYVSGRLDSTKVLETDANGRVSFSYQTLADACTVYVTSSPCSPTSDVSFAATPASGEETEIRADDAVTVRRTHASITTTASRDEKTNVVTVNMLAKTVDPEHIEAWNASEYGEPMRNTAISGNVVKHQWVATQTGTSYDPIEKKTSPTYSYDQVVSAVQTFSATTDVSGKATATFTISPDKDAWFEVIPMLPDGKGNIEYGSTYVYTDWSGGGYPSGDNRINFQMISPKDSASVDVGQPVTLGFVQNDAMMQKADGQHFLYVSAHLGITSSAVSEDPTEQISLSSTDLPNVNVMGVAYLNGGFVEGSVDVVFDTDQRNITVDMTPDQTSYAPGAKAVVHVKATQKDGKPAASARFALGAVDDALYAASGWSDGTETPLSTLYQWVSNGIVYHQASMSPKGMPASMNGGAERGGGGGAGDFTSVRKNFKDTATFQLVTLDANGQGDVTFTMPDNMTSWRVTGVAVTPGLFAGSVQVKMAVTKPVFVDAVIPSPMLTADKPVIKLRAYGTGLKAGSPITFVVDAPTLGLKQETVTGKAGESTYVTVASLPVGDHVLTIGVKSDAGNDAMEKHLVVVASRFTHQEFTSTDLGPGSTLPDPGASREVTVSLLSRTRAQYLNDVESLQWSWSSRVEAQVAKQISTNLLINQFGKKDLISDDVSLARYQQTDGGIALLPYGSSDPEVSAKLAAIAPKAFDQNMLTAYFYQITQNKNVTREEAARAYAGLAALGNPVLLQLQSLAKQTDLNWHEQLAVIRGLDAAGDREGARTLFAELLKKGEEKDGKMVIRVEDARSSIDQATAEAAGLAAELGDASAPKLFASLDATWSEDAFNVLDKADVLQRVVPTAIAQDASVTYQLNSDTKTVILKDGYGEDIKLTADEAKAFRVMSNTGPAVAVMSRDIVGVPTSTKDITVSRTYTAEGKDMTKLVEGDVVTVTLKPNWLNGAWPGCYAVRDVLPAGLFPQVREMNVFMAGSATISPDTVNGNAVSFTVCPTIPSKDQPVVLTYKARVMTRGSFKAEPVLVQSLESPSVQAVSGEDQINIK